MDEMPRSGSSLGMLMEQSCLGMFMEHVSWGLPQLDTFFRPSVDDAAPHCRVEFVWNGREGMKLHMWMWVFPNLTTFSQFSCSGGHRRHVNDGHCSQVDDDDFAAVAVVDAALTTIWLQWPSSSSPRLGMLCNHIGGGLAQFDDFFDGWVAVELYALFLPWCRFCSDSDSYKLITLEPIIGFLKFKKFWDQLKNRITITLVCGLSFLCSMAWVKC